VSAASPSRAPTYLLRVSICVRAPVEPLARALCFTVIIAMMVRMRAVCDGS